VIVLVFIFSDVVTHGTQGNQDSNSCIYGMLCSVLSCIKMNTISREVRIIHANGVSLFTLIFIIPATELRAEENKNDWDKYTENNFRPPERCSVYFSVLDLKRTDIPCYQKVYRSIGITQIV
jgi:hypothetical protein